MSAPLCSVIIPSYNRRATLEMVLEGLALQTFPRDGFEVIAVLDGSSDTSAEMLKEWQAAGRLARLRWQLQPNRGQAVARNQGALLAEAPVLLFLDDDIVPEPDVIARHLEWHAAGSSLAVLGSCPVEREQHDSLYHLGVWAWWEDRYHQRALPGRQAGLRDFCAGNVSLRRADFLAVGGFDPDFKGYGGEDFELGYRLLRAGVEFIADSQACARHHHRTTVPGVLHATRQEAHGDALLGRKHPELRAGLRLMHLPPGRYRYLALLALVAPALGDRIMAVLQRLLPILERFQMRRRWLAWFNHLRGYAYWRGVRDTLGSLSSLKDYQAGALPLPRITLDLTHGLPADLPPLWVDGPSEIELAFEGRSLGVLELPTSIENPLRPHLASQLLSQHAASLWLALAQSSNPAPLAPAAFQKTEGVET